MPTAQERLRRAKNAINNSRLSHKAMCLHIHCLEDTIATLTRERDEARREVEELRAKIERLQNHVVSGDEISTNDLPNTNWS